MFLWARSVTTQIVLGLLTSTAPSPSVSEWIFEAWVDLCGLLPLSIVVGQLFIRVAATLNVSKPLKKIVPPGIHTFVCQCILADVVLAILLHSIAGQVDGVSIDGWNATWGWNGPFLIFTARFLAVCIGLAVGETFFPLALTGGIACGKSTASKLLKERNFNMIDADKIGHQILLPPWHVDLNANDALVRPSDSVYVKILETFADDNATAGEGSAVKGVNENHPLLNDDKEIDRLKLGAKVFANPADRKKLNSITHPKIFTCLLRNMASSLYFGKSDWTCAEVPLLFESGPLRYIFGLNMVVACTETQQYERLRKRNPELPAEECQKRIESQLPMTVKVQKADIVLWNDQEYSDAKGGGEKKKEDTKEEEKTEDDDKKEDTDEAAKAAAAAKQQQEDALAKQVDKAVTIIQQRVRGVVDTTASQMLVLLAGSIIISACFKLVVSGIPSEF